MLPGLVLHSLVEVTCGILVDVWFHGARNGHHSTASAAKEELAMAILLRLRRQKTSEIGENASSHLIFVATGIARSLVKAGTRGSVVSMPDLLELIFNVWVDKLVYASTRGRTDSHIKQLSSGGELTTIVWIMAQHAGPYRIGPDRGPLRIGEILARSDDGNFGSDEQSDDDSNFGSDEQPGGDGQQFG